MDQVWPRQVCLGFSAAFFFPLFLVPLSHFRPVSSLFRPRFETADVSFPPPWVVCFYCAVFCRRSQKFGRFKPPSVRAQEGIRLLLPTQTFFLYFLRSCRGFSPFGPRPSFVAHRGHFFGQHPRAWESTPVFFGAGFFFFLYPPAFPPPAFLSAPTLSFLFPLMFQQLCFVCPCCGR